MENKRGRKANARVPEDPTADQITFDLFFAGCVRDGKLNHWQHREIRAFFTGLGLGEKADPKAYEAALGKF